MILYHGTVKLYLASILANGLKPTPQNRWQASWPEGDNIAEMEEDGVYLSLYKEHAQYFAKVKTRYLRTVPGKKFRFSYTFFLKKDGPVLQTTPVVLRIDLPEDHKHFLRIDKADLGGLGLIYSGEIQPRFISEE